MNTYPIPKSSIKNSTILIWLLWRRMPSKIWRVNNIICLSQFLLRSRKKKQRNILRSWTNHLLSHVKSLRLVWEKAKRLFQNSKSNNLGICSKNSESLIRSLKKLKAFLKEFTLEPKSYPKTTKFSMIKKLNWSLTALLKSAQIGSLMISITNGYIFLILFWKNPLLLHRSSAWSMKLLIFYSNTSVKIMLSCFIVQIMMGKQGWQEADQLQCLLE